MIVLLDYADNRGHKEIKINATDKENAICKIQSKLISYNIKHVKYNEKITIFDTTTGPIAEITTKGVYHEKAD